MKEISYRVESLSYICRDGRNNRLAHPGLKKIQRERKKLKQHQRSIDHVVHLGPIMLKTQGCVNLRQIVLNCHILNLSKIIYISAK